VLSLLRVRGVVATKDAFEDTGSNILTRFSGLHAIVKSEPRFFEGAEGDFGVVRSARDVVV
jgi:hypothetical protein